MFRASFLAVVDESSRSSVGPDPGSGGPTPSWHQGIVALLDGDRGELDETGVPGRLAIFDDRSAVLRLPGLDPRAGRAPVPPGRVRARHRARERPRCTGDTPETRRQPEALLIDAVALGVSWSEPRRTRTWRRQGRSPIGTGVSPNPM